MNVLKTLLKRQKRLIIIFLLTIVLPSLALSIFGILAIRNEKYQREQQILDEQQSAMMLLKRQFSDQLKNVEALLQNTARLPAFRNRDFIAIRKQLTLLLTGNEPVDQVFILFEEGKLFFPLLQSTPDTFKNSEPVLTSTQQTLLTQGLKAEFTDNDYETAIPLFRELVEKVSEENTRAQMLNNLARAQKKSGMITLAINTYYRIIKQYPSSLTSASLPLVLTAEMQIIDCDRISGNKKQALDRALTLYDKILDCEWKLTENQFLMYAEMSGETVEELLNVDSVSTSNQDQRRYYATLQEKHQMRVGQWKDRRHIEAEIIPALKELTQQFSQDPIHLFRMIQGKDFLITAVSVSGLLCVKWDSNRMIREWLQPIVDNLQMNKGFSVIITDLSGRVLLGDKNQKHDSISFTGEFDSYFPPWKIRMARLVSNSEIGIDLFKSYYFWSILTLMMILIFGTMLIIRTIGREREIMAMKSDFIASVSHELKTPLTSIRALTERLLADKVKDPEKMHQYFSVIDKDANKLMRLVRNILDFSKIEAGKKEYIFEITDITVWLDETIDDFCNDHIQEQIEIRKQFDTDIPSVAIDRDALSQCMNNLLDNAIKFSPDSKSVDVNLTKESEFINIQVKDKGIGIPKEDLKRIFDKFFQGTPSIRQSLKGTGLGLALVKHTVEAHGGGIEVQSNPGQGSTFTLFLPIINLKL